MERKEIVILVLDQLKSLNETLPEDQKFEVSMETVLFGNGSSIDSLSLVSVIVDIEMFFLDNFDRELSLTDDRAMTREVSPFENVKSLISYIYELVNE